NHYEMEDGSEVSDASVEEILNSDEESEKQQPSKTSCGRPRKSTQETPRDLEVDHKTRWELSSENEQYTVL
ncbi:hypothetical protein JTB14_002331, partial [Gonioctena quinquepunctata]